MAGELRAGRGRACVVAGVIVVVAAAGVSTASADVGLVLPTASLPGLHATRVSVPAARADLAAGLPGRISSRVSRAAVQTAAAGGPGVRLRSDAFVFGSAGTARAVLAAWRGVHRAHGVAVGSGGYGYTRGSLAMIAWREGDRIGLVSVRARRAFSLASEYAVLADEWLRSPPPRTAWEKVLDQVRPDGSVSKATALQAFALAYGGLPGVRAPSGARMRVPSGTLAGAWVLRYLPRLSSRLRRVIDRDLGFAPGSGAARIASFGDPKFTPNAALTQAADHWASVEGDASHLDHTLQLTIVAGITTDNLDGADADSYPVDATGKFSASGPFCRIRVAAATAAGDQQYLLFVLAHEVFHCFQFELDPKWGVQAAWLIEGTAEWAAQSVDPIPSKPADAWQWEYIATPRTNLFERTYDAIGYWGHAQDIVGGLWSDMSTILNAGSNDASFVAAGGPTNPSLDSWGTSFFRASAGGPLWQIFSPVTPPSYFQDPVPVEVLNGGTGIVVANALTTAQYHLEFRPTRPVVHVVISGSARLDPYYNYTDLRDAWFCTEPGECFCPSGTTGAVPATLPLSSNTLLGLSGGEFTGTSGTVTSYSLDDFCQPTTPPPSNTGPGTGGSFGDPYITTFDESRAGGGSYGFQTTGEFTLVMSTVDNLEIQARLQPFPSRFSGNDLAMNTAFAMRDGGAVVEVDNPTSTIFQPGALVLYLDRRRADVRSGQSTALAGGGRVRYTRAQVTVTWPDGTVAVVYRLLTHYGVNISVTPSRERAGRLVGLLGNDNGNVNDDYVGRNGTVYPAKLVQGFEVFSSSSRAKHVVLDEFGASWRITPATSLFVYAPGKNTYSYIVKGFPRRPISAQSLTRGERAAALAACQRAHVTNAALLGGCVVDVGATGQRQLAASARTFQRATGLPPTAPRGLSGRWSGHYTGAFNGTFTLDWKETGSTLSGTIVLSNPRDTVHIDGTVSATGIRFGTVGFATYSGAVSGGFMSGTYNTPKGGGSWSATKIS
jgi:hypothetical protein